ncbi:MAG TPA: ATP-binding protein, partial [Candidatus Portnoybacteria bacterium]|nr:ATP-binding protein [Candidatus Portnoybacteria bacterium]
MIKRDILQPIIDHLDEKEITVIIGPRQVGKTTLLDQIEKYLSQERQVPKINIFRFNLDVIRDRDFFQKQDEVINFIKSRKKEGELLYFFIDEVQRIKDAGIFIKGIYDLNLGVKFILTGSSSLEIKTKIQEALTGRKKVFQVMPLTINEYLRYIDEQLFDVVQQGEQIIDYDLVKLMKIINDFVVFGGYPRMAIETNPDKKISILEELYTSYLDKDIKDFLGIKKINAFNKLVSLLSAQTGNLLNIDQLSSDIGIEVRTVNEYLNALTNTFVISLIYPFFTNRKKELVKAPKIYFIDTGLRNFAIARFDNLDKRDDKGAVFENAVASELLKSIKIPTTLNYWRTLQKAELDFVLRSGDGKLT